MRNGAKVITGFTILAIVGAILAVVGCGGDSEDSAATQTQTVAVSKGTLLSTITAIGNISMPEKAALTFGGSTSTSTLSTIKEIAVSFGDSVKKGDVLAKIDTASLQRAVDQAKASLRTAQISLEQASSETNTLKAKAAVESAKASVASADKDLGDVQTPYSAADIAKAQAAVDSAAVNLSIAEQDLKDTQDSTVADAESAVVTAQVALDNAQRSLTDAQNSGDISITNAKTSVSTAQKAYDTYVQTNIANLTRADIAAQKDTLAENIMIAQSNLEVAKSQAASSIATAGNNVTTAQNSLQSAQDNLTQMKDNPPVIKQKQSAVATAQAALDKAKEDLAQMKADPVTIQQKQSAVATAKANLAAAQDDLAYTQAGHDIELLKIQVDNAQVSVDNATEQLEAATIVAPFDGVVSAVNATIGDQVTSTTDIIDIVNTSKVEIDGSVDETDVASVKVGQTVAITLDAISSAKLSGTVSAISPVAKISSSVVTYALTIAVPDTGGYDLKEGMTASADITVLNKADVLLIPSSAITQRGPASFVNVIATDGTTEQRVIVTGETDGTNTEIISGLTEGEKVVIATNGTSASKTPTNPTNGTFPDFGGGGGPPPGF